MEHYQRASSRLKLAAMLSFGTKTMLCVVLFWGEVSIPHFAIYSAVGGGGGARRIVRIEATVQLPAFSDCIHK